MSWFGPQAPGRRPKYLDRPLTQAERARLYRLRKKGVTVPVADPLADARAALAAYDAVAGTSCDAATKAALNCVKQLRIILGEY